MHGDSEDINYPALFDEAPCALARTSASGLFLQVNKTFCTWLGYRAEDVVNTRRIQDLFTIGGKIFHQTHWLPLLQMQGSVSEIRLEVMHKDGSVFPMIMNAVQRKLDTGVVHDIAAFTSRDRDSFEQELLSSRKKLEALHAESKRLHEQAADRALFAEQMMGIVSHDLRNPLSVIQMGARALGRGELAAPQLQFVNRISRAADRANRMITDLLDFTQARIGRGLAVTPVSVPLHKIIANAVDEFAHVFSDHQFRHVQQGQDTAHADADRISQLVINLISNAVAYGQPGSAITVTSSVSGSEARLSVQNIGDPIPPDLQSELFKPLVRGDAASNPGRSIGLGLYIVSEIAKAHGGSVRVLSSVDHGTEFTVTLPNAQA